MNENYRCIKMHITSNIVIIEKCRRWSWSRGLIWWDTIRSTDCVINLNPWLKMEPERSNGRYSLIRPIPSPVTMINCMFVNTHLNLPYTHYKWLRCLTDWAHQMTNDARMTYHFCITITGIVGYARVVINWSLKNKYGIERFNKDPSAIRIWARSRLTSHAVPMSNSNKHSSRT